MRIAQQYLAPLTEALYFSPNDTLSILLNRIPQSHGAGLVMDKKKLLGIVSGNRAVYQHRFPPRTKLKSCLFFPPYLTAQTSLDEVIRLMRETKIYTLPLFEKQEIIGVIRARDIVKSLLKDKVLLSYAAEHLSIRTAITALAQISTQEAYTILRNKDISRLVLINETNALVGIVARSDIFPFFANRERLARYTTKNGGEQFSVEERRSNDFEKPVEQFATMTNVYTLPQQLSTTEKIIRFIKSGKTSAVIVDKRRHPVGIISTRSILSALMPEKSMVAITVSFHQLEEGRDQIEQAKITLAHALTKINEHNSARRLEGNISGKSGFPKGITVALVLLLNSGKRFAAQAKHKELLVAVHEAVERLNKQMRREH